MDGVKVEAERFKYTELSALLCPALLRGGDRRVIGVK